MIKPEWLRLLDSPDPDQRRQAITALGKARDRDALPHLARVYRSDPDPELRDLARKAGLYISKNAPGNPPPAPTSSYYDDDDFNNTSLYDDDDEDDTGSSSYKSDTRTKSYVEVSQGDQKRALTLVSQAEDAYHRGDQKRAEKSLKMAFEKNPNLQHESYTVGVASMIMGLPSQQAVQALLSGDSSRTKRPKQMSAPEDPDNPSWGSAFIDLAIYWLVNVGIALLMFIVLIGFVNSLISQITDLREAEELRRDLAIITSQEGVLAFIGNSVTTATSSLVGLLIQYAALHFVGLYMLGGEASFTRLIRKMTLFYTFAYPIYIALVVFAVVYDVGNQGRTNTFQTVSILGVLGITGITAYLLGETYRFGIGRGCAAMILSYIVLVCFGFMIAYTLLTLAPDAFLSLAEGM